MAKSISKEELKRILEEHGTWLETGGEKGRNADLRDADLRYADLRYADLRDADLETWGQVLLKYVLANPAVTCAIPGTGESAHMEANCGAAEGRLPDGALCRRMAADWDAL